jgi:polyisoprenoid-binding protein YceI
MRCSVSTWLALIALIALIAGTDARAADFAMQAGSSLTFTASYQGEAFTGRFGRFTPQIRFDPADLAHSVFDVRIVLTSVDTQNGDRDDMLKGGDFFDTRAQPEARYVANKFRPLGGGRFVADGVLTLHGVSKPAPLSFTWTAGAKPVLVGEAQLKRLDFNVGTGDWADLDLIPNDVKVSTKLILAPVAAKPTPTKK